MKLGRAWAWCLSFGILQAQSTPEALDVVPPGAMVYLFAKSPLLVQAKIQGLIQRLGGKETKEEDPLTEAQTRFGLRRLPVDRRGMVLVYTEAPGQKDAQPLVFLAIKDAKPLLEELKAQPGEGGLYRFQAKGVARALALRDGWAILGDRGQAGALRKAAKEQGGLRASLGELASWVEARDAAGVLTGEGLWSLMQEFRKQAGAGRGRATNGAADPLAKAEQFLAQAQREIRHVGFGAEVDEHGNLQGVLRLQLQPQGQWAQMTAGLDEAQDFGLGGLNGEKFMIAMGGVLPRAWMTEAALLSFAGPMAQAPLSDSEQLDRQQAIERVTRQVRGMHMAMCPPPEGLQQVLQVEDAEAYLREQEAFWTMESARRGALLRVEAQRIRVNDHEALALMTMPPEEALAQLKALPAEAAEAQKAAMRVPVSTFIKLDPRTIAIQTGPQAPMAPGRPQPPPLKEADSVKAAAKLLPARAHFFAFVDLHGAMDTHGEAMQAMEASLTEEQRRGLPTVPERPAFPPMALALRYEEGAWELHLGMSWETQLGLAHQQEDQKAALARSMAVQKALQEKAKQGAPAATAEPDDED